MKPKLLKLRTNVHMHDPTKFPNICFSKKKALNNFCLFRFKVSIHKVFNQRTPSLKIFHLEFYVIVQYHLHPHFQQATHVYFQVAQVQILKKNWLVVWKMTWGICKIFIRTLEKVKIGTFMGSFCSK